MKEIEPKTQMAMAIRFTYRLAYGIVIYGAIWAVAYTFFTEGTSTSALVITILFSMVTTGMALILIASTFSSIKSRLDDTDKRLRHLERPQD